MSTVASFLGAPPVNNTAPLAVHTPIPTPLSTKAGSVAQRTFKASENSPKKTTCCGRFWSFLKCLTFPLSWVIEKIIEAVKGIINCCGTIDPAYDPDPELPDSPTSAPSVPIRTGRSSRPSGSGLAHLAAEELSSSVQVTTDEKATRLCRYGDGLAQALPALIKLKEDAAKGILNLKGGTPAAPAPKLILTQFFELLCNVNELVGRFKKDLENREGSFKKYQSAFTALFKLSDLSEKQQKALKENEAKVLASQKDSEETAKQGGEVVREWDAFLNDNKKDICERFGDYQKAQSAKFDVLLAKSGPVAKAQSVPTVAARPAPVVATTDPKKKGLELYNNYMSTFNVMKAWGWVKDDDAVHIELKKKRAPLGDALGLTNPSNSCWRNSTLQALRGIEDISERIKTLKAPARLFMESEEQFKERLANRGPLAPQRKAETDAELEKRLQDFENKYPVKRSEAVEKMLHDARMEIYNRLVSKEGVALPQLRNAETDEEFQTRVKAHNLIDYAARMSGTPQAKYIPSTLLGKEKEYKKNNHAENNVLAAIPAETDAEFAARKAQYDTDSNRKAESDEVVALKQQVLDALKAVWYAWENDEEALDKALDALDDAIFNGVNKAEFSPQHRGEQLDSGDLVSVFMDVLGYSFDLSEKYECSRLAVSQTKVNPAHKLTLPLIDDAAKIESANELIKAYAQSKKVDPSKNSWNVFAAGKLQTVNDYTNTYRIMSDPPPVMAIHLDRRVTGNAQAIKAKIDGLGDLDAIITVAADEALGHQPSTAQKMKSLRAVKDALARVFSEPDKLDRPVTVEPTLELTDLFDETIQAKCGGTAITYRPLAFTSQAGGANGGHWVGYRVDPSGQWRYYSDSTVELKTQAEIREAIKTSNVLICKRVT